MLTSGIEWPASTGGLRCPDGNTRAKRTIADIRSRFGNLTMRHILAFCLLLAIALPCQAQGDKAKPNTLTPKEIADGWILLFDGETTFGWKWSSLAKTDLVLTNNMIDLKALGLIAITTWAEYREFELQFEYRSEGRRGCFVLSTAEPTERYPKGHVGHIPLEEAAEWTTYAVRSQDGKAMAGNNRPAAWPHGTAIRFEQDRDKTLQVRNIKLRPLNSKPLFNAKDLTGWREFPGKKSKFTVTDSAINVKDGPGDLQTVGKYQDFVLQVECKSNGKHLNSGIFFRCKENEYQNGYEAQILNKFSPEATQKYLIEEYDPKTNKLLGKKEIMSTAFDYGTGAIYRRVPARKQMSKDGEWFGMTIVAHGNHLATWVNGVQVTDWFDNRPKSDNARTGCRLEAGHVSIQGHDPTTDLSFRNLRIAELK